MIGALISPRLRGRLTERTQLARLATLSQNTALMRAGPTPGSVDALFSIVRGDTPTQYQRTGKTVRIEGHERNAVVQACGRLVSELIAAVPIEVYKKGASGDRDVNILPKHPLLSVLEQPWFTMSPYHLRMHTAWHYLTYGNAFWEIQRGTKDPQDPKDITSKATGLRLIHPERIMYVYLDEVALEPYLWDWRDRNGARHQTAAANMVHFADLGSVDWLFGWPRAASAISDFIADNEACEYVRQVVKNDGTAGTIIEVDEAGMTPVELAAAEDRYYEKRVGRGMRGTTQFMSGIKNVHKIGFPLKDLEFPGLRQVAREDICAAYGVDPRMIGVGSASKDGGLSGQQYKEARFRLIQQTVIPTMRAHEAVLNLWLAPEFGDVYVRYSPDGLSDLTEDESETWTRTTETVSKGVITREEGRRTLGYPDKPDPNDTEYIPRGVSVVPVEMEFIDANAQAIDLQTKQATLDSKQLALAEQKKGGTQGGANAEPVPGDRDKGKDTPKAPGGDGGQEPNEGLPVAGAPKGKGDQGKPTKAVTRAAARALASHPDMRKAMWAATDEKATSLEPAYHTAAASRFAVEKRKVADVMRSYAGRRIARTSVPSTELGPALERLQQLYAINRGEFWKEWVETFSDVIGDTASDVGADMASALGVSFDAANPQLALMIEQRAKHLANYVSGTTSDAITAAVQAGLASGLGIKEVATLIESSVFGESMTSTRATMIARTESIGALNAAEHTTAKLSGVVNEKEWLTVGDDRVRESHADQDGETVDLDEPFTNGLMYPGDPEGDAEEVINCRCTLLYHVPGEEGDTTEAGDAGDEE